MGLQHYPRLGCPRTASSVPCPVSAKGRRCITHPARPTPSVVQQRRQLSVPCRFGPEIRAVYPHRWPVPRDVWHTLFANAEHEIDILVYNGLFLFEDTGITQLLATKADTGARIRILLSDPESPEVAQRDQDERIGDRLLTNPHIYGMPTSGHP